SGASPARSSARQTPGATDNTSPRSPRSGGLRPPCSGPAKPEHRLAAASQRSLQACIASSPLQSSWMSKTYLKSDHFIGGGSALAREFHIWCVRRLTHARAAHMPRCQQYGTQRQDASGLIHSAFAVSPRSSSCFRKRSHPSTARFTRKNHHVDQFQSQRSASRIHRASH